MFNLQSFRYEEHSVLQAQIMFLSCVSLIY